MNRIFVSLKEFDVLWRSLNFNDEELRELESFLIQYPQHGKVIQGTGGLRKLRWALPGKGKSGGIRIFYVDFPTYEVIYFISLIKKNEKENITQEEKNIIFHLINSIEKNLSNSRNKELDYENKKRGN